MQQLSLIISRTCVWPQCARELFKFTLLFLDTFSFPNVACVTFEYRYIKQILCSSVYERATFVLPIKTCTCSYFLRILNFIYLASSRFFLSSEYHLCVTLFVDPLVYCKIRLAFNAISRLQCQQRARSFVTCPNTVTDLTSPNASGYLSVSPPRRLNDLINALKRTPYGTIAIILFQNVTFI